MPHNKNIKSFLIGANGQDPLMKCYCGLVAIELSIKHQVGLKDHNVINGLVIFSRAQQPWAQRALTAFADRLRRDLVVLIANNSKGVVGPVSMDSYPNMRYCRFAEDGWDQPCTTEQQLNVLAGTVQEVRTFLRRNFSLPI